MLFKLFLVLGSLICLLGGSISASQYIVPLDEIPTVSPRPYSDCGVANDVITKTKITGGEETAPNEFPWMALLFVFKSINGVTVSSEFCGGSLIADQWILTSASCLAVPTGQLVTNVTVYLGATKVASVDQKTYFGNEIYVHPEWNRTTQAGDIALLKLSTVVEYTKYIRPICLPSSSEPDYVNQQVIVAGYNQFVVSPDSAVVEFHKMTVSVVPNSECNATYNNLITDRMMCTGGANNETGICKGDKGDPMTFKQPDGIYKQIGIVSFAPYSSSRCQVAAAPSAYTRLSSYSIWIQGVVWPDFMSPSPATPTTPTTPSPSSSSTSSGMSSAVLFLLVSFVSYSSILVN